LLELIIVIIIVGVLAGLALPRFFRMIERSRSVEAMNYIGNIRRALDRCNLFRGGTVCCTFDWINIGDNTGATAVPNSHFTYSMIGFCIGPDCDCIITATRNLVNNGDGFSTIAQNISGEISGTGVFQGI